MVFPGVSQEGSKSGPRKNLRLLKANYIKEFTFLRQAEDPLDLKNCYLDLSSLQAREESAIRSGFLPFIGGCFGGLILASYVDLVGLLLIVVFEGKRKLKRRGLEWE